MANIQVNILNNYKTISLGEMDTVKLMNRIDTKYVLKRELVPGILDKISGEYQIVEIDDKKIFLYQSLYYDIQANTMYLAHHNGWPDRNKIRLRKYLAIGISCGLPNVAIIELKRDAAIGKSPLINALS